MKKKRQPSTQALFFDALRSQDAAIDFLLFIVEHQAKQITNLGKKLDRLESTGSTQ